MDQPDLFRILKFGIVGSLGMVVNFVLNRYWTFQSNGHVPVQLARFFAVALIGLALNTGIIFLLSRRRVNFYFSKAIAIAIVFFWNYSANAFFTFAK
jgi:putative flippase GtrA